MLRFARNDEGGRKKFGKKIQPHLHLFVGGAFYEIYFFNLQMKNYEKASIIRSFEKCNRKMQGMDEQVEKR